MSTTETIDLAALKEPFPQADIEWRVGEADKKGDKIWAKVLAYVTNRAIMDRLDKVVGPMNWRNEYAPGPQGGVICGISIRLDGEWITKWDGAENTEFEAVKGGLSNAMKRAAVQWGIGRYLYDLETNWANVNDSGKHFGRLPEKRGGDRFRWDPPLMPVQFLPADEWPAGTKPRAPKNGAAPKAKAENDVPGEHVSVVAKAQTALINAMTTKDLDKYFTAIRHRTEAGEFSADEFTALEKLFLARMKVLMPTTEKVTA